MSSSTIYQAPTKIGVWKYLETHGLCDTAFPHFLGSLPVVSLALIQRIGILLSHLFVVLGSAILVEELAQTML